MQRCSIQVAKNSYTSAFLHFFKFWNPTSWTTTHQICVRLNKQTRPDDCRELCFRIQQKIIFESTWYLRFDLWSITTTISFLFLVVNSFYFVLFIDCKMEIFFSIFFDNKLNHWINRNLITIEHFKINNYDSIISLA